MSAEVIVPFLATIALAVALIVASAFDLRSRRLPGCLTLSLLALGLLLTLGTASDRLRLHVFAALPGFLTFYLVATFYRRFRGVDGLSLGDAKLLAAAGAWLGPLYLAPVVFVSALLVLGFALMLRLLGR